MKLSQFQNQVIEDAIQSAHEVYRDNEVLRSGSIAGLEACRGLDVDQLSTLLVAANTAAVHAKRVRNPRTMEAVAFRMEVLWVCQVVSVVLDNQGMKGITEPTPPAYMKAAEIIGSERHFLQ